MYGSSVRRTTREAGSTFGRFLRGRSHRIWLSSNAAEATVSRIPDTRTADASNPFLRTSSSRHEPVPWKGLQRLPTAVLVRNLFLGVFFSSPLLFRPGFAILRRIARSQSPLLNPDSNPIIRLILKPLLYDQFCAGTTQKEISRTRDNIRQTGYSGVALCYGKEGPLSPSSAVGSSRNDEIEHWKQGNLQTLGMVQSGDWLAMKFTGAGSETTNALLRGEEPPLALVQAMHAICQKAIDRDCRLWIDGEQQSLQASIDDWAIQFMRYYNKNGQALVYNTLQSYLKSSRSKLEHQLALAASEDWTLAIKLVRGAYIGSDRRSLIHSTKEETDESYNSITQDLLSGRNLGCLESQSPKVALLLAGHNPESVARAWNLISSLSSQGKLRVLPDFAQLQGMGDELGCRFLQLSEDLALERKPDVPIPRMYKCLTWGSVQECMQYLFRRAIENSGGTDRMRDGMVAYRSELKRRLLASFRSSRNRVTS